VRAEVTAVPEVVITGFDTVDVRFPTSLRLDGSDAMNLAPDYSAAYVILRTSDPDLEGHGFCFTIGRGTDICVQAIRALAPARRRQPATLARPGEGRHPPGHRGGRQRRLGPVRQDARQAAVEAARRPGPRGDRRAGRLPLPDRRAHP